METLGICAHQTVDQRPTLNKYPMHSHAGFEILLLLSSSCSFQVGDWTFHMEKGDVVIIPENMPHRLLWEDDGKETKTLEFYYTQFESQFLPQESIFDSYKMDLSSNSIFVWKLDNASLDFVIACFQRLIQINETNVLETFLTYLRPVLREIKLCENTVLGKKNHVRKQLRNGAMLFDQVSLYIHEHYADIRDLSFVTDVFHYSVVYVNSLFKRYVKVSLWQYVINVRLARAHDRLMEGTPVEKAARDCGFDDYSNFYRMFRKQYGMPPSACKKSEILSPNNS